MHISLNNRTEMIEDVNQISVADLLKYKKFSFKMIVMKINNQLIKKEDYEITIIKDGDDVLALHLMSGG